MNSPRRFAIIELLATLSDFGPRQSFFRFIPDPVSGGFGRKLQIVPEVFRQVEEFYVTIDEQNRGNGLFGKVLEATSGD